MSGIKKIPVIGYILRLILGIVKLPWHLDSLYQEMKNLREREDILQQDKEILQRKQEALQQKQELFWHTCEEFSQWQTGQQMAVDELRRWNSDRMEDIRGVQARVGVLEQFDVGPEYVQKLNLVTSLYPTLWGDKERLHISDLAAVSSCTFNTNSGDITIGDYTFSGSGVSILAGSHDMRLTGLLRRDVELAEGCDIEIGSGVWLASNCTILGPAKIGDNAVIAAGAVVTPGTVIPENTIYGGVPARHIGDIKAEDLEDISNPAVMAALNRNHCVLYVKGWTEKRELLYGDKKYTGHYMVGQKAKIYFKKKRFAVFYQLLNVEECEFAVQIDKQKEERYQLLEPEGTIEFVGDDNSEENNAIHILSVFLKTEGVGLFIATLA